MTLILALMGFYGLLLLLRSARAGAPRVHCVLEAFELPSSTRTITHIFVTNGSTDSEEPCEKVYVRLLQLRSEKMPTMYS